MGAIERVAECWRRLYWRNWKWISDEHARIYMQLSLLRRTDATAACRGCGQLAIDAAQLGDGVVCEGCLVHALVYLVDDDVDSEHRALALHLLLGAEW